jgi:hypothetical protein
LERFLDCFGGDGDLGGLGGLWARLVGGAWRWIWGGGGGGALASMIPPSLRLLFWLGVCPALEPSQNASQAKNNLLTIQHGHQANTTQRNTTQHSTTQQTTPNQVEPNPNRLTQSFSANRTLCSARRSAWAPTPQTPPRCRRRRSSRRARWRRTRARSRGGEGLLASIRSFGPAFSSRAVGGPSVFRV